MDLRLFWRNLLLGLVLLGAALWLEWKPFDILFVWWLELVLYGAVNFLKTLWIFIGGAISSSPLVKRTRGSHKIAAALLVLVLVGGIIFMIFSVIYFAPYQVISVLSFQAMANLTGTHIPGVATYAQSFGLISLSETPKVVKYAIELLDLPFLLFALAFLFLSLKDASSLWHHFEDKKDSTSADEHGKKTQELQVLLIGKIWWASLERFIIFGVIMLMGLFLGSGNLLLTLILLATFRAASDTFLAGTSIYEIALKQVAGRASP